MIVAVPLNDIQKASVVPLHDMFCQGTAYGVLTSDLATLVKREKIHRRRGQTMNSKGYYRRYGRY